MRTVTDKQGNRWEIEETPINAPVPAGESGTPARSPFDILRARSGDREIKIEVMAGTLAATSEPYLRDLIDVAIDKQKS